MRLRTDEPFWLITNGLISSYPSLQEHHHTGILVVGGGITGSLISHALMDAGYNDVTVVDKRDIGQGSTSATTSLLQYEIDVPLIKLAEILGEEAAAACYAAGITAINKLDELINYRSVECGFRRKKSLYIAHNRRSSQWLHDEFEMRRKHDLGVEWLDAGLIRRDYNLRSFGGILSDTAASLDAYRLAHELFRINTQRGLKIYDHTEVSATEYSADGVKFVTDRDFRIEAEKVVYCSGFETLSLFNKKYADIISTFACVSEQGIELHENLYGTLVWDTEEPYLYMRTTDDGRLLAGGEDVPFNSGAYRERFKRRKAEKLVKKLQKLIPGVRFIEDFHWGGAFGTTPDGLPYIGTHPDFPSAVFVLGLGGNGITFSVQGMDLVPKILRGENDRLLHYYRFDR